MTNPSPLTAEWRRKLAYMRKVDPRGPQGGDRNDLRMGKAQSAGPVRKLVPRICEASVARIRPSAVKTGVVSRSNNRAYGDDGAGRDQVTDH
jgi:hypothetical protein